MILLPALRKILKIQKLTQQSELLIGRAWNSRDALFLCVPPDLTSPNSSFLRVVPCMSPPCLPGLRCVITALPPLCHVSPCSHHGIISRCHHHLTCAPPLSSIQRQRVNPIFLIPVLISIYFFSWSFLRCLASMYN